ncbi:type 1 glutamine amidotransferase domain-containing protein [Corynebacterium endometrii]|uniref:General stress protein 18 n=1 Tax=Corynebacterium endometrii TaxID=2488819 RepID=A0A4P7QJU4_9CORY|nr:type 1 glutamine amidotransferase domain-containing protein [Corynebacterium endometrii]QCB29346.1 General stress protein 18 [Corynebacterium endometrii]
MSSNLQGKLIAVLSVDGFEDSELTSPLQAVKDAGAEVRVVSKETGTISGKNDTQVTVDSTFADERETTFDGIILPGGTGNADQIRLDADAVAIVKAHVEAGRPLGAICHAAWILTDADVISGRTLTSYPSLKTDLTNAGASWVDEECVCDSGLVTSRTPDDLPAFNAKIVEEFAEGEH